jgi:urease accessory protein
MPATTGTTTRTLTSTCTEIVAERRGDRTVLTTLRGDGPLRARMLPAEGGVARVALVQSAAMLLAGDAVAVAVRVGAGAALELVEVGATICHAAHGRGAARLDARLELEEGARLHWDAWPVIACEGCDVDRRVQASVAAGAALALREAVVLARTGERPGRLRSRTRIDHDGRPLYADGLDTSDPEVLRSAVVLGARRVLDQVGVFGLRPPDAPGVMQLAGPGAIRVEAAATHAATVRALAAPHAAWRSLVLQGR